MIDRLSAALENRYRIERELGQGGMATVYLAEDLKHDRKVAVKVLKPELAAVVGGERFISEIRTTANLQHPHILPLFDSGQAEGLLFYVMPYVEGETLRERIDREKQLPVDEAVGIVHKVLAALDEAHDQGVIHRDIKPANILLDRRGEPLIADFGIALAVQEAGGGRLTETGLSLGTPYYMSPEQATGDRDPDARSDLYSVGCVLYEMLTGEPPFGGATAQAIVGRILTAEPTPPTEARRSIPPNVEAAVLTALEKTPADRFASAADFGAALQDGSYRRTGGAAARAVASTGTSPLGPTGWLIAAVAFALVFLGGWWVGGSSRSDPAGPMARATILVGGEGLLAATEDEARTNAGRPSTRLLALSPDGSTLVFVGMRNGAAWLFRRGLDAPEATPIDGTQGAAIPFFSPDGRQVGFWSDGRLWRVPLDGGTPAEITAMSRPRGGAAWGDDDHIVFGGLRGLRRVAASGGSVQDLPSPSDARLPHMLPGGDEILYTVGWDEEVRVEVLSRATGRIDTLVENASDARYLPTGHLAFARVGTLMTIPFDSKALEVTGGPTGVLSDVMHAMNGNNTVVMTDAAQFAVSAAGHLAYVEGGITPNYSDDIVWLDRSGTATSVGFERRIYNMRRVGPDDETVVVSARGDQGIWVMDADRAGPGRKVSDQFGVGLVWDQDGETVTYISYPSDSLFSVRADGSEPPTFVGETDGFPIDWTPDGTELLVLTGARRLDALEMEAGESRVVLEEPGGIQWPHLSPNGDWLVYEVSGEIVTRSYPALGERRVVARGESPAWTRGGSELLFTQESPDGSVAMLALDFDPSAGRVVGEPEELFRRSDLGFGTPLRGYDPTSDGARMLVSVGSSPDAPPRPEIHLWLNWFDKLREPPGN